VTSIDQVNSTYLIQLVGAQSVLRLVGRSVPASLLVTSTAQHVSQLVTSIAHVYGCFLVPFEGGWVVAQATVA
jgi:hypothetical protein